MRWKRRVVSRFGKGHTGSMATVNKRVKTTDEASNHGARTPSPGPHLIIASSANLEEKLVHIFNK